ncbi:MAG: PBP1A family penicillin-binding protein [Acidobacteriota bacterium]
MQELWQRLIRKFTIYWQELKANNAVPQLSLPNWLTLVLTNTTFWLSVLTVLSTLILIFYYHYWYYTRIIDARLEAGFFTRTVDLYTPSLLLEPSQRFSPQALRLHLKRLGYLPRPRATAPASFVLQVGAITIVPRETEGTRVRIEFLGNHNEVATIVRLVNLDRGGELERYEVPGLLLATVSNGERCRSQPLKYSEIPKRLIDATLAIEDRRFFAHPGIDYRGILRALSINFQRGEISQGGSTITQQLIKTIFKMNERTFQRKFVEAFLALALERRLTKQEIFTYYANEIYLGQDGDVAIRGFAEAAQFYFGKRLDDLSLAETATLAGLIRGPSLYSPQRNYERALVRRKEVLQAMQEIGVITSAEYQQACRAKLKIFSPMAVPVTAPYFIDYASNQLQGLLAQLPEYGRFRATLTIDYQLQQLAERIIAKNIDRLRRRGRSTQQLQAALVALEPTTGDVMAIVGGRDYRYSNFNRATAALRQPGSAFKPFVYTAAFSTNRFNPGSVMRDEAQVFIDDRGREYQPKNYGGHFDGGEVTLRQAFARSLNTITVTLAEQVGLDNIASIAERAGLPKPKPYLSMALGTFEATPLEMASAYAVFANGGQYISPRTVQAITAANGNRVAALSQTSRTVCSQSVAYLITDMMQSVITAGTATQAGWLRSLSAVAGKTGTSRDGWFIGYTPKLVVAVWVGYDDNQDLKLTGGHSALPIWEDFMGEALALRPDLCASQFPRPAGLIEIMIDADTGLRANESCQHTRSELVVSGLEPMPCYHSEYTTYVNDKYLPQDLPMPTTWRRRVLVNADFEDQDEWQEDEWREDEWRKNEWREDDWQEQEDDKQD